MPPCLKCIKHILGAALFLELDGATSTPYSLPSSSSRHLAILFFHCWLLSYGTKRVSLATYFFSFSIEPVWSTTQNETEAA
ncbi:MAG: hypothetical protein J3R72DRAFT_453893 [Linnemannia gamsii]|nr:MAG: hypothetical protein J3R72DRAFT_453893 [Linnemannia gamsii]